MAEQKLSGGSSKEKSESLVLGHDSIKATSESVGITQIPDHAIGYLAEEATYRIKEILQVNKSLF